MVIFNQDYKDVLALIPDKSVDLVLTDPPYLHKKGHTYKDYAANKSAFANSSLYRFEGKMMSEMNWFGEEQIYELLDSCRRVLKKMNAYFCCSESQVLYYNLWAERHGYHFTILVWEKPLSIISKNRYSQNVEFIVRVYEHGTGLQKITNSQLYNRVSHDSVISGRNKLHPTEKPVSLMSKFVELSSKRGEVILDPFMGSGTTGVACLNLGRWFIGIEKDPHYFEIARNRLNVNTNLIYAN